MSKTQYTARTRVPRWFRGYSLLIVYIALMTGCASVPDRTPLPADLYHLAEIPGIPKARYWGDEPPPWAEEWFALSREEHKVNHPGVFGTIAAGGFPARDPNRFLRFLPSIQRLGGSPGRQARDPQLRV